MQLEQPVDGDKPAPRRPVGIVVEQPGQPGTLKRGVDPRRVASEELALQHPRGLVKLLDDVVCERGRQLRGLPSLHLDALDAQ